MRVMRTAPPCLNLVNVDVRSIGLVGSQRTVRSAPRHLSLKEVARRRPPSRDGLLSASRWPLDDLVVSTRAARTSLHTDDRSR